MVLENPRAVSSRSLRVIAFAVLAAECPTSSVMRGVVVVDDAVGYRDCGAKRSTATRGVVVFVAHALTRPAATDVLVGERSPPAFGAGRREARPRSSPLSLQGEGLGVRQDR